MKSFKIDTDKLSNYFLSRTTTQVFALYLFFIFIFGCTYWLCSIPFSQGVESVTLDFSDAIYFSVVTITTLGYGDISPSSSIGKFLTGTEAVIGIVTLGLLLTSISMSIAKKYQDEAKIQSLTMAIRIIYVTNISVVSSYAYSVIDLINLFKQIEHPKFDETKASPRDAAMFKSSIEKNMNVIFIQSLKRITSEKKKVIELLQKVYAVADPTVNTKLLVCIETLNKNSLFPLLQVIIDDLDETKNIVMKADNLNSIYTFSNSLQNINNWLLSESKYIELIQNDINSFLGIENRS